MDSKYGIPYKQPKNEELEAHVFDKLAERQTVARRERDDHLDSDQWEAEKRRMFEYQMSKKLGKRVQQKRFEMLEELYPNLADV